MSDVPGHVAPAEPPSRPLELRPLYVQARDLLLRRIIDGVWKPGDYLPGEADLAGELRISIGTIRKAAEDLVGQGLLERLHGRGTRVAAQSSDRARFRFMRFRHPDERPFEPVARLRRHSREAASPDDRRRLALAADEDVLILARERRQDGRVLVFERLALPSGLFGRLDLPPVGTDLSEELYVLYQQQCGVTVTRTHDDVEPAAAKDEVAMALGVRAGTPLLKVNRTAFGLDGRAIEYRQSWTADLHYVVDLD